MKNGNKLGQKRNSVQSVDDEPVVKETKTCDYLDRLTEDGNSLIEIADHFALEYQHKCGHGGQRCPHCVYHSICSDCQPLHLNTVRLDATLLASNVGLKFYLFVFYFITIISLLKE